MEQEMSWQYIAGYLDGEGCLLLGVVQDHRRSWKSEIDYWNFIPSISVSSYDYEVLLRIKEFTEKNHISTSHYYLKPKRQNQTKRPARLSFNGYKNVKNVIDKIYPYSIAKKEQYRLYYQIYDLLNQRERRGLHRNTMWDKITWLRVIKLVDEINSLKSRGHAGRIWYPYFSEKWKMKI